MEEDLVLTNGFSDLDDLGLGGYRMGFDLAPRGPVVGRVVMVDVTEHQAALCTMEDQPDVTAGVGRPEVFVLDVVEAVALQAWVGGIDLQLEGGELGGFLLIAIEFLKAGLEAVGEEERHQVNLINDLS